mmetsp:Transcript_49445/g.160241  ORF Transcript_49445/g.160241 Transcript_49445/m.160241 type:complete len:807 (+) Transcript_49445:62-2482(+)
MAKANTRTSSWTGAGMSQHDFMLKDECLVLNYNDEVIGADNKYNTHKFVAGQPKGVVHRAFSVMLFDSTGRLLLQQRAASKVTFPRVWTNTCCSHPLHGQTPDEVDPPRTETSGEPKGIFAAAVRKLKHELGIEPAQLADAKFKYMGRVHYWAADTVTHGPAAPWGEHEIDYLVLVRLPVEAAAFALAPEADEVMATEWVDATRLRQWMGEPTELWSPWFRVIARERLYGWWEDLDAAWRLKAELPILRFDAPPEHRKGDGSHEGRAACELSQLYAQEQGWGAAKWGSDERRDATLRYEREARRYDLTNRNRSSAAAAANKQGGYGKVPQHSASKVRQMARVDELFSAVWLKFGSRALSSNLVVPKAGAAGTAAGEASDLVFCDRILGLVSRSFAAVIRQLPAEMVLDVLLFYLVLRALDTIEDDMEAFKDDEAAKCRHLTAFADSYLGDEAWSLDGVGEGAERELLQRFGAVSRLFNSLPAESREVIRDITRRMGAGMAEQVGVDLGQGTADLAMYNRYCHAVAGLVGEGLTRSFVARGFESVSIAGQGRLTWPFCRPAEEAAGGANYGLANSMGLFLQKTNILRDYLEDYVDGRAFWPQSVWREFARTSDLGEFARPTAHGGGLYASAFDAAADPQGGAVIGKGTRTSALACLNFLVADALELVPDSLEYLRRLRTPEVFRFSAIPQVMAIATLEACFDNPQVFSGVVKIRKGQAAQLILACGTMPAVEAWFHDFATRIKRRTPADDPSRPKILAAAEEVIRLTAASAAEQRQRAAVRNALPAAAVAVAVAALATRYLGVFAGA